MTATYQAMPENCELLVRSRRDPAFGDGFVDFSGFCLEGIHIKKENLHLYKPIDREFIVAAQQALIDYPGLCKRRADINKAWTSLPTLLSVHWQTRTINIDDIAYQAIHGVEIIHPDIHGGQGGIPRYSPPAKVKEVHQFLQTLTPDILEMRLRQWYSTLVNDYDILHFLTLKSFYEKAAAHHEGVICMID